MPGTDIRIDERGLALLQKLTDLLRDESDILQRLGRGPGLGAAADELQQHR